MKGEINTKQAAGLIKEKRREGKNAAVLGDMMGGESTVWTRSTGDMSHGEQSPRGLVGAVYKWK